MKRFRKSICLILVVLMLAGLTSAFAATTTNPDRYDYDCYAGYKTYTCIGDSIAAGYTVSGIYMDPIGLGFNRVTGAYHDLVATGINANLQQLGCSAFRTVELRYILDGVYTDTDGIWGMAFSQAFAIENLDALRPYFIAALKASDIVTINLGSNDVLSYSYIRAMIKMYEDNTSDAQKAAMEKIAENGGDVGQAFVNMINTAKSLGKLPVVLGEFTSAFNEAFAKYKDNWNASLKAIYELNPDIQIITVGVYNPANNISITDGGFKIGAFMQPFVDTLNGFLKSGQDYAGTAPYADVDGTETWPISVTGGDFTAKYNWCSHPTRAGHMYMAAKIMEVIPNRYIDEEPVETDPVETDPVETDPAETDPVETDPVETDPVETDPVETDPVETDDPDALPFTDVKEGRFYYEPVKYCYENNLMKGKTDTKFAPNDLTTRAELATVLYRMAGFPTVTDEMRAACPFTDLKSGKFYCDPVAWAYSEGVVKGVSATKFAPDQNVTREQIVAMLYRFANAEAPTGDLSAFKDAASVGKFAVKPMIWAVNNGIITGRTADTLVPKDNATRGELAAMLYRFANMNG